MGRNIQKITIITVVYNGEQTIGDTVASVLSQSHPLIEYIIVDGASSDRTLAVIKKNINSISKVISAPDRGIYDAMNKGIGLATGDIIGMLNSDDLYVNRHVISKIARIFEDPSVDACYTDLLYVDRTNTDKIIRYWKSKSYRDGLFEKGWVPPHPTFFVRRSIYEQFGNFDLQFKIAADYELMLRLIALGKIKAIYLPEVTIKMRMGGTTNRSLNNILKQNCEIYAAARKHGLQLSPLFFLLKLCEKLPQFYRHPEPII